MFCCFFCFDKTMDRKKTYFCWSLSGEVVRHEMPRNVFFLSWPLPQTTKLLSENSLEVNCLQNWG